MGAGVGRTGLIHRTECPGELTRKVTPVPGLGIDLLKIMQMLGKGILNGVELLQAALGLLGLALHEDDGTGEFVGDFIATALEIILTSGQLLEAILLLLDLLLTLAELEKLILGPLDLVL